MRLPISYALSYPERNVGDYGRIDWTKQKVLEFEAPDLERFPCLAMAIDVARLGGAAPAWFNAANEVAVAAFLEGKIKWTQIAETIADSLAEFSQVNLKTADDVVALDSASRAATEELIAKIL